MRRPDRIGMRRPDRIVLRGPDRASTGDPGPEAHACTFAWTTLACVVRTALARAVMAVRGLAGMQVWSWTALACTARTALACADPWIGIRLQTNEQFIFSSTRASSRTSTRRRARNSRASDRGSTCASKSTKCRWSSSRTSTLSRPTSSAASCPASRTSDASR